MDNYEIIVIKNNERILSHEESFPTFVGEDHSIRFVALELLSKILEEHPSFFNDIYAVLVKHQR